VLKIPFRVFSSIGITAVLATACSAIWAASFVAPAARRGKNQGSATRGGGGGSLGLGSDAGGTALLEGASPDFSLRKLKRLSFHGIKTFEERSYANERGQPYDYRV
jgi:hypothetical protein